MLQGPTQEQPPVQASEGSLRSKHVTQGSKRSRFPLSNNHISKLLKAHSGAGMYPRALSTQGPHSGTTTCPVSEGPLRSKHAPPGLRAFESPTQGQPHVQASEVPLGQACALGLRALKGPTQGHPHVQACEGSLRSKHVPQGSKR